MIIRVKINKKCN